MAEHADRAGRSSVAELPPDCRNCSEPLTGVYCSACGESHRHARLELGTLLAEVLDGLVNLDTRVLRTVGELSVGPGQVVRDYLDGRRVPYVGPFKYAFATFTFAFAVAHALAWLGKLPGEPNPDPDAVELQVLMLHWGQTLNFLVMPVFALALQLGFAGRPRAGGAIGSARPLRWIEAYVLVLFALGHVALLQGLLTPFLPYVGFVGLVVFAALPIFWVAWTLVELARTPWWSTLLRVALAFVIGLQLPAIALARAIATISP